MFLGMKTLAQRRRGAEGRGIAVVLIALIAFLVTGCPQDPPPVIDDRISITSQEDMAKIGVDDDYPLSGKYLLANDITLSNWSPIGAVTTTGGNATTAATVATGTPFSGAFDGNGKTITLTSFDTTVLAEQNYIGIFGFVRGASASAKAEIKNLTVHSSVDTSSETAQVVGIVTGYAEQAVIDNITLSGNFSFTSTRTIRLGGIVGSIFGADTFVKNSNSSMEMDIVPGNGNAVSDGGGAYSYVGGFVGIFRGGAGIEHCHYTGDLTADNVRHATSGQVFAGGIAGGSLYGFSQGYYGYISDSSSTGTILAKAKGNWTFVGGIAGTIIGGNINNDEQTTRIVRCFATGTVSLAGTNSGFPYIGGIVGYLYYGALVSQSYFNGTVICDKSSLYVGGITGYSSQQPSPNNARIEDCWTGGLIQGFSSAAGIVGQQATADNIIRRTYSRATVIATSANGNVAGIAGVIVAGTNPNVTANVALNPSITAFGGTNIGRITGTATGNRANNYAWSGMIVKIGDDPATIDNEDKGADTRHGADCAEKPNQAFYVSLGWDFVNVWKMGSDGYPKLRWQ